jgi:inner membrane transporter RhtA
MASIQFGASLAKELFPTLGVAATSGLRLIFASAMLAAVFRPWETKITKSIFLYGASLGAMNFSFYFALERIPLGVAVALEFTGPLVVAILSSKKKTDFLWALVAAIGLGLLIPKTELERELDPIGLLLALLAGFFWALYILFGKKAGKGLPSGVVASLGMLVASLVVLPMGVVIDGKAFFTWSAWPLALLVAFFGSALPYSLEMIALKEIPAQTFAVMMSLEPALAALVGYLYLKERLGVSECLAIFCVMVASAGSAWGNRIKNLNTAE